MRAPLRRRGVVLFLGRSALGRVLLLYPARGGWGGGGLVGGLRGDLLGGGRGENNFFLKRFHLSISEKSFNCPNVSTKYTVVRERY